MTNAESERKIFWEKFHNILKVKGNPFMFTESDKQWACINSNNSNWHRTCLVIDFLVRDEILNINLYINNDISLFEMLKAKKEYIENILGFKVSWENGLKEGNARRIKTHIPFTLYDHSDYERIIEKVIPIINSYIKVFSCYIDK
jgi:hypothetical protein